MHFTKGRGYDPEIAQVQTQTTATSDQEMPLARKEMATPTDSLEEGNAWYAKAHRYMSRFGVESRGIERVPSNERSTAGMSQIGTMWLSANMVVSSFALGALSYPVFYLGFVVAILNTLACIGWSAINVIVGAQLFNAVNPAMPGWAGIIVIAVATLIVTLFGYKIVHAYERYSWIPCFIIFLIVLGEFAHSGQFLNNPMGVGKSETGALLSFAASIFGFATGWTSYAADYTVYQPVDRSRKSIFLWTFAGLMFPLLFTEMLGAAVATAMASNNGDNAFMANYTRSGIGGLLSSVLVPPLGRFGQFCIVILALSIIANNCPNIYSVSLSLQVLSSATARVPRFVWTFVGTIIYCGIAIPGYGNFETVLENFMLLIAYWLAIYQGISLSEHIFFKKGFQGYRPENYMDASRLPPGIAAMVASLFGVMGAVLGMAQVWFTGPIGKLCGVKYGGDVGFELAFAFSATSYCGLRWMEIKKFGR
ncbi:Purine-cytosine permease fcy21 [Ciborinia camelliae]|nr:Purine-cytosine permease fcy21 [Ciborinia camelliae]